MKFIFLPLIMVLLITPWPCLAWLAKVSRIVDGDTIIVEKNDGHTARIRLYGIDCPELSQPYGREAKVFLESFLLNKETFIEEVSLDRYKRVVAVVYVTESQTIQAALLMEGFAWVYPQYCKRIECFSWRKQEEKAKELLLGLWEAPDREPPWAWRKGKASRRAR